MSQQRKTAGTARGGDELKAANAIPEQRILDAAYELFLAVGMRRMTMADIARKAEVSRATLYRRWGSVREMIAAVMTREWATLGASVVDGGLGATGRERLVSGIVEIVRAIRVHPLLRKIVELDPDFLLPYLMQRRGTSTDQQLGLVEAGIRQGIADGSIRTDDVAMLATSVVLAAWSFTLTGPVFVDAPQGSGPAVDRLDEQLAELLERYLAP